MRRCQARDCTPAVQMSTDGKASPCRGRGHYYILETHVKSPWRWYKAYGGLVAKGVKGSLVLPLNREKGRKMLSRADERAIDKTFEAVQDKDNMKRIKIHRKYNAEVPENLHTNVFRAHNPHH